MSLMLLRILRGQQLKKEREKVKEKRSQLLYLTHQEMHFWISITIYMCLRLSVSPRCTSTESLVLVLSWLFHWNTAHAFLRKPQTNPSPTILAIKSKLMSLRKLRKSLMKKLKKSERRKKRQESPISLRAPLGLNLLRSLSSLSRGSMFFALTHLVKTAHSLMSKGSLLLTQQEILLKSGSVENKKI